MTNRVEISGLVLTADGSGQVRLSFKEDKSGALVWSWPRTSSPCFPTMGEEFARALALIDGTFDVVARRPERG